MKFFESGNSIVPKTSQTIAPSRYIYDIINVFYLEIKFRIKEYGNKINKQRRKYDENVPEYTSRYGFKADPYPNIRNKKDPTEYSGQAPHWSDVEPKYRKGYYSQLQKPKVGMMERIMYKLRGGDEALIK